MARRCCALAILASSFFAAQTPARAVQDAALSGRVLERGGLPLPGATVILRNRALALREQAIITGADGRFRFSFLAPGAHYELTVSLPGSTTIVFSDLLLEPGGTLVQDVVLRPTTELKETVRVEGKGQTLDTEKVTASTTFTSTFIAELPILGRDYQDILSLAPGVTDVNGTGNPNIHGARDTDVVTLVDGVSTTDPFTGYFGQNLNIESIQELEVITSAATAQYSRAQGGFANILTRSGSNEFVGTFKLFVRSGLLDGDGAGLDEPELTGGFQGDKAIREQHFTDLMPFLSVSGKMVPDRLWYYLAAEYIHEETPVNAGTHAFVTPVYGYRGFIKTTWQISSSNRLAFSVILDKERRENQGIDSLADTGSGYYLTRGGPTFTLRESAVFTPTRMLESTVSWFDNRFAQNPTTDPDTNGNGVLYIDDCPEWGGNGDGVFDAKERDPGEDWDWDGRYDLFEDMDFNGGDDSEDLDGDGWTRDLKQGCEGYDHEDLNCNGRLDAEIDANLNDTLDPEEDVGIPYACSDPLSYCPASYEGNSRGNGRFDSEDRNGNGVLDVVGDSGYSTAPFWSDANGNGIPEPGEYRQPLPADRDLSTDIEGRTDGPALNDYHDHRKRFSWLEDFSIYVADALGNHDLKLGGVFEHEAYDSETFQRPMFTYPTQSLSRQVPGTSPGPTRNNDRTLVRLGIPGNVENTATGDNLGLYLQDTWKPVPNLTLSLGLRFDFESLESYGYTPFVPAEERRQYDALMQVAGLDLNSRDHLATAGLCLDPIHSCSPGEDLGLSVLINQISAAGFGRMTRHPIDVDILSKRLSALTGGSDDLSEALGYAVRARTPEQFSITNSNLAPRLGLSWDPAADGKTMLFGSWGRYYDKLFLRSLVQEQGPDSVLREYTFDFGVDEEGYPTHGIGNAISQSPLSSLLVDRGLSTPYSDEWTAGAQRELAPEVLVSLRYIHRDFHDQLQDIDLNHHFELDPLTGQPIDIMGSVECPAGRGCESFPNGMPDLYIENFFFNRVLSLGNYNEQRYRAWEIEFVRRLKRKWQMEASYTYSTARGDAESFLSVLGNDPAMAEYEESYLDYDQRHVIKFNAVAFLPGDWRLGGTILWSSGLPYSYVNHVNDTDDAGYREMRMLFGHLGTDGYGFTPERRNIHRNPASYLINTRIMKSFVLGKSAASAFLEVYNLLNADNLRVYSSEEVPARYLLNGAVRIPPSSRLVSERDFGRRFQVGFQIDF